MNDQADKSVSQVYSLVKQLVDESQEDCDGAMKVVRERIKDCADVETIGLKQASNLMGALSSYAYLFNRYRARVDVFQELGADSNLDDLYGAVEKIRSRAYENPEKFINIEVYMAQLDFIPEKIEDLISVSQ